MNSELLEHYQVTVDSENTKESIHGTFGEVVSSVQGLSLSDCLNTCSCSKKCRLAFAEEPETALEGYSRWVGEE